MKFHFVTVVWGEEYTAHFLNRCLPNQLTPGNLHAFKDTGGALYKIYTTRKDAGSIENSENYKRVKYILPVSLNIMDEDSLENIAGDEKYRKTIDLMNSLHGRAIKEANADDAAIFILTPDALWSEGAFSKARDIVKGGKRVVLLPQLRVAQETFLPEYERLFGAGNGGCPAPARELTKLALAHMHPYTKTFYVDSPNFSTEFTWYLFWRAGESGLVARCLYFHPFLIYPKVKDAVPMVAVDHDYPAMAVPEYKDYYFVKDSDEIAGYEFSPAGKLAEFISPGQFNERDFTWNALARYSRPLNRKMLLNPIVAHGGEVTREFMEAREESGRIARRLVAMFELAQRYKNWQEKPRPRNMDHVKRVVIFGSGSGGRKMIPVAARLGWSVAYIVDNDSARWGGVVDGCGIKGPDALGSADYDLIMVSSGPGREGIFAQLYGLGYKYGRDYIYYQDTVIVGGELISLFDY
ncbi:MAG: hypothetical protein HY751_02500 [Nitrospinae bacterium]|nr:hypothetical protein [Nitrospinota bacterium]